MDKLLIKCPAKINLSLDIIGRRDDGYHLLKMLMQSVSLFDEVTIEKNTTDINIHCDNNQVPCDETNICHKAAGLMKDKYDIKDGLNIFICKNIPIAAGLAGGSTDAAGVILGINELYNLNLNINEMMDLGIKVGADVPYCLNRGTALVEGIGEVVTNLREVNAWCVLAKPNISVSTAAVFGKFRLHEVVKHPDTEMLIEYIKNGDLENLSQNMVNVLETVTIKKYSIILEIKNIMMEFNALGSIMSGSGPTVFGLFNNKLEAEKCYHRLRDYLKEVYIVQTTN